MSILEKCGYFFEFSKTSSNSKNRSDLKVLDTIIEIIRHFLFNVNTKAILIFTYEQDKKTSHARKRLFKRWLEKLNMNDEFLIVDIDTTSSNIEEDYMTLTTRKDNRDSYDLFK